MTILMLTCSWLKIRHVRLISVLRNIPFSYCSRGPSPFCSLGTSCPAHLYVRLRPSLQFRRHVNNMNSATNYYDDQLPYTVARGLHSGIDLCLAYRDSSTNLSHCVVPV